MLGVGAAWAVSECEVRLAQLGDVSEHMEERGLTRIPLEAHRSLQGVHKFSFDNDMFNVL